MISSHHTPYIFKYYKCHCQLFYEIITEKQRTMPAFCKNIFWLCKNLKYFITKILFYMRGNNKNRYFRRVCFIFDKNNLIHCHPSPVVVTLSRHEMVSKRNINWKNHIKTSITVLSGWMTSSYISLQILPGKESLGIHYFILKNDCYFEPLGYVMGGCVVLDLSSILFINPELHCTRFALLCNSEIIYQTGAQSPFPCLKRLPTRLL